MGRRWQLDDDRVPGPHNPARDDHPHDASLAHQRAIGCTPEDGSRQAGLKPIELLARIAQASNSDDGRRADVKLGVDGQRQ